MSELDTELSFYNYAPHPLERASVYIGDGMDENARDTAEQIARVLCREDKPIEQTVVLIPVAANQDAGHIFPAMREYARQRGCDPFTICLLLNYPIDSESDASDDGRDECFQQIEQAEEEFPSLDIRAAEVGYSNGATIGQKRGDLWNATFMTAYIDGKFDEGLDVIGLNHDIDTTFISPHYMARVQQHYARRQARALAVGAPHGVLPPVGTRVSHAVFDTHPHVGMVTRWIDNTYFQHADHASYEAGLAIPFSHYAQRGGFNIDDITHETARFSPKGSLKHLTGAQLLTSPRRYIDRVGENGSQNIWTKESFGPEDACRDHLRPDITKEQAEDIIVDRLHDDLSLSWLFDNMADIFRGFSDATLADLGSKSFVAGLRDRMHERAQKQITKAERLLRYVVGSEVLASMARDCLDVTEYVDSTVHAAVAFNKVWLRQQDRLSDSIDNRGDNL